MNADGLVNLPDGCKVDPSNIREIKINPQAGMVVVRMDDGSKHVILPGDGEELLDTFRRVCYLCLSLRNPP